jgi:glycosyltransferase involved in cell wall biosynthesis
VTRRLGVVGSVVYPAAMDVSAGDVRTWLEVGRYFEDITVIAQTRGLRPRRRRFGNVRYILLPQLPRPFDAVTFPVGATVTALGAYVRGVKTWSFSDPLRCGLVCVAMRSLPGARVIVHIQGQLLDMPSNRFGRATILVEALSRFVARRADTVRVVSRQIARDAAAFGVPKNRIAVVPSRCDTDFFDPERWRDSGRARRSAFPGDPASPVVGFLGGLNASKGLDVLIAACSMLAERRSIRVAIAGAGPLRYELELAAGRGVPPIALLGQLPPSEVPSFLAAVDVLAVPSYDEGLPRVVLEAMAMQVPVVASNVGGIPEAVQDAHTGFLVPPGDAVALAAALERLLDDPGLGSRFGSAGRQRARQAFDALQGWRRLAALHDSAELLRG